MRKADRSGDEAYRGLARGYKKRALQHISEKEFAALIKAYVQANAEGYATVGSVWKKYSENLPKKEAASNVICIEKAVASLFQGIPYVKEFTGGMYCGRIDMLFVNEDDVLTAVEIKSDRDNLNRLARQLIESKLIFDFSYAAIDIRHYDAFVKKYAGLGTGLIVYDGKNAEIVSKPAYRNERSCYFDFLWKRELISLARPFVKNPEKLRVAELCDIIKKNMTFDSLCSEARRIFAERLRNKAADSMKKTSWKDEAPRKEMG